MTLTLPLTRKARLRKRIHQLPEATSVSHVCAVWVRVNGRLACKVCGRP